MVLCELQHTLNETEEADMSEEKTKQKRPGDIIKTITLNGREATSTKGAIAILKEVTDREYSRDAIYRFYLEGKIEGERTDIANYYYIDSLRAIKDKLSQKRGERAGRKKEQHNYPPEIKEQALELHEQGLSYRKIGKRLDVSYQTVNNWLKNK